MDGSRGLQSTGKVPHGSVAERRLNYFVGFDFNRRSATDTLFAACHRGLKAAATIAGSLCDCTKSEVSPQANSLHNFFWTSIFAKSKVKATKKIVPHSVIE